MKNIKALLVIAGFSAAAGLAGPASAQMSMSSAYIGASFGQSDLGDSCSTVAGFGVSCDDKDTAWKILGGYQFNRNFAAELGYTNLGEITLTGPGGTATVEVTAFELVGVGIFPIANQFSVYGKLGFARGEAETGGAAAGFSDSSTDLTYGIGVQYDFSQQLGVRAEWQRYDFDAAVDVMSIGVVFRFQ
jgi:OOP family OmpA-OmpF porin